MTEKYQKTPFVEFARYYELMGILSDGKETKPTERIFLRSKIIKNNLGLVRKITLNYFNRIKAYSGYTKNKDEANGLMEKQAGMLDHHFEIDMVDFSIEDYFQVGVEGAIKALDKYNPHKGIDFGTFAGKFVEGAIAHFRRDYGRAIRVPRTKQEAYSAIVRESEKKQIPIEEICKHPKSAISLDEFAKISSTMRGSFEDINDGIEIASENEKEPETMNGISDDLLHIVGHLNEKHQNTIKLFIKQTKLTGISQNSFDKKNGNRLTQAIKEAKAYINGSSKCQACGSWQNTFLMGKLRCLKCRQIIISELS